MMEKERNGVRIIGIFFLICIIPTFIIVLSQGMFKFGLFGIPLGILSPLLFYICGRGLLLFKNWARIFTLVSSPLLSTLLFIVLFWMLPWICHVSTMSGIFVTMFLAKLGAIIFFFFILYYLTRPKVKEQFK